MNPICRRERAVAARAAAADGRRRSRRGSLGTTDGRVPLVHPAGFPATLASKRAQATALACPSVAIHRTTVTAESHNARHNAAGRLESERVPEPR